MRSSRLNFKYILRQCQSNEEMIRADAMARSLTDKDSVSFWKHVRKSNSIHTPLSSNVNGVTGSSKITEMWSDHYKALLNSVKNETDKFSVQTYVNNSNLGCDDHTVQPCNVLEAIRSLKRGKSSGCDNLAAEHFKYCDESVNVLLSLLFSCCIVHGHVPGNFMKTTIIPLVKNKAGDCSDVNNYRPIAIVTIMSKIFELVLFEYLEKYLQTSANQFGFKKKHSTDLCIYALKNVLHYYRNHNSPIYTCFFDASKAFDKVNHWNLFKKLIYRGVPIILIRILLFWYRNQTFCVKWGSCTSMFFTVGNGVRQGSILSPHLFAVYVDDLSVNLIDSGQGCCIDNVFINHLFYADDLCLMAPSPSALQRLINICDQFCIDNDLVFNPGKSICMFIKPPRCKLKCPHFYIGNNQLLFAHTVKYLGVFLCDDLNDNNYMNRQLRSLYARANTLLRKFSKCSISVKLTLFQSYCSNAYCSHLWANYTKATFNKLKVAYNNVYRRLLGCTRRDSASMMLVTNGIDSFETLYRKYIYKFMKRVEYSSNVIINRMYGNYLVRGGAMHSTWQKCLYT